MPPGYALVFSLLCFNRNPTILHKCSLLSTKWQVAGYSVVKLKFAAEVACLDGAQA